MNLRRLAANVTHEKSLKKREEKMEIFLRELMSTKEGRNLREEVISTVARNLGSSAEAGLED
jgi:hypothetical protein